MTFNEFLKQWVKDDPENEGCYTLQDVEIMYEQRQSEPDGFEVMQNQYRQYEEDCLFIN